jgi:hypothetical protein
VEKGFANGDSRDALAPSGKPCLWVLPTIVIKRVNSSKFVARFPGGELPNRDYGRFV